MQKNLFCCLASASSNFVMTFGLRCAPRFSWGCCTIGFGHSTRWCAGSSPPPPIFGPPATDDVLRFGRGRSAADPRPLVLRPAFQEPKARCRPRPKTSLSALMFRPLTKNRAAAALTPGTTTSLPLWLEASFSTWFCASERGPLDRWIFNPKNSHM